MRKAKSIWLKIDEHSEIRKICSRKSALCLGRLGTVLTEASFTPLYDGFTYLELIQFIDIDHYDVTSMERVLCVPHSGCPFEADLACHWHVAQ
jgi:hypothetical protein